jgi:hypothetical protein
MRLRRAAPGAAAHGAPVASGAKRRGAALRRTSAAVLAACLLAAAALSTLRARRGGDVRLTLRPPALLTPLLPRGAPPLDVPGTCNGRAHTELHGHVVRAGFNASDAAACCAACAAHEGAPGCSAWVYCGDAARCGAQLHQCWLKRVEDAGAVLESLGRGGFRSDAWASGLVLPQPVASYVAAAAGARARAQRGDLTLLPARGLLVGLRNGSGTLEALSPRNAEAFSFLLPLRDAEVRLDGDATLDRTPDGFHHLGDFTLRSRGGAADAEGATCSSVAAGQLAADAASPGELARDGDAWRHVRAVPLARVAAGARTAAPCPLRVTRTVASDPGAHDGALQLRLEVRNPATAAAPVTLEALGLSMPFDQLFAGRSLVQVAAQCAFVEPFLGAAGGYVQVTRATGDGPVLLLLPLPGTAFEAWRPLKQEDKMAPGFMYENTYELVLLSAGYVAREWAAAPQWNVGSAAELAPGEAKTFGLRAVLAASPADVEATLLREGHPVVQLLPGAVLHADVTAAAAVLLLPAGFAAEASVEVEPTGNIVAEPCVQEVATAPGAAAARLRCALRPADVPADGARVRLTFALRPGGGLPPLRVTAHVFAAAPAPRLVAALGAHTAGPAWMPPGRPDPWRRDAAFFGWDARCNCSATQEARVFMSGLSDEAGAAAALALAMKQLGAPDAEQIAKLETFAHETLFQGDSPDRGAFIQASADHAVRLSQLFWNDELNDEGSERGRAATAAAPELARVCRECWRAPGGCNWMICWSEEHSLENWRAYNYPHVTAVWWALYRLARWHAPPLATRAPWQWYLRRAVDTAVAMFDRGGDPWTKTAGGGKGTAQWGLMVGSVFELLLSDLLREGWSEQAAALQRTVERRMAVWLAMPFPYGSEFAWDSTGHEEIATWMARFGHAADAATTVRAITGYVTLTPHWAFAGSARRWWDFGINGAGRGNERTFHHYAAALNSIPLFDAALAARDDAWLWRLAGAAGAGSLTNIRADGSASMGWHADNDLLSRDPYSADFGIGFYGHAKHAGAYLSCSAAGGWLCVGCDVEAVAAAALPACGAAGSLRVTPRDAFRRRLYLQPLGVLLQLDGGVIDSALLTLRGGGGGASAALQLRPALAGARAALLTLRADGGGGRAPELARELALSCAAPCALLPGPFPAAAAVGDHVLQLRFGAESARLGMTAAAP